LPAGIFFITARPSTLPRLQQLAKEVGLTFDATASRPGPDAVKLKKVRIGLWDRYGGSMPSGWTRWIFEQFEFPFEVVYPKALDAGNLRSRFDVLVFVGGIPGPYNAAASAASSVAPGRELGGPNLYFDPCAYSFASAWELGNLGRNTLIGPSLVKWDFSLAKNFAVTEQWNLQFRSELFNIFNHANFSGPAASMFSATGGKQGTAGVISRTLIGNQRQIQFALRLTF